MDVRSASHAASPASPSGAAGRSGFDRLLIVLVPLTVLAAALGWRFAAPGFWTWTIAGLALWTGLLIGGLAPATARAALPGTALLAALLALAGVLPALWPCDLACAGGGAYRTIAGLDVRFLAAAGLFAWAVLAFRDARRQASTLDQIATWAAFGASAYFLWLSLRLDLLCPNCLAVHTAVLTGACLAVRDGYPIGRRCVAGLLAFLLLHFAQHGGLTGVRLDVLLPSDLTTPAKPPGSAPGSGTAASTTEEIAATIRRHRAFAYRGAGNSAHTATPAGTATPTELSIFLDPHCSVCAKLHASLPALAAALRDRVDLDVRFLLRRSDPSGLDLARHALAAAALGSDVYAVYQSVAMGSADGLDFAALRERFAEAGVPAREIALCLATDAEAVQLVLAEDIARLSALDARGSGAPRLILHVGNRVLRRIPGDDPAAVADLVRAALAP